jgi:hypothetical protein
MGLQERVPKDTPDRSVADLEALSPEILPQQRGGPPDDWESDVLRRTARFSYDLGAVGL